MRLWPLVVLVGLQACATLQQGPSVAEAGQRQAFDAVQVASAKRDWPGVEAGIEQARVAAGDDLHGLDLVLRAKLAVLIEHDDVDGAWALMTQRLSAYEKAHLFDHALHDEAIFVCEARGDTLCAVLEAMEMMGEAAKTEEAPEQLMLGTWWQRAHTLRSFAESLEGPNKVAAIAYAQQAREAFNALAVARQESLQSIVILDEQFAALDGQCKAALEKAHSLDVKSLDPQDAYITAGVLEMCGDNEGGAALRKQIGSTGDFGLFSAVYRYLARH